MNSIKKSVKKNQNVIFFFSILLIVFTFIMGSNLGWLAPLDPDDQEIYLLSGDIIKNFDIESFDGSPLTAGDETMDGKMKFDYFPVWRIAKEDIRLIRKWTDGDDAYIRYRVAMTNKLNIYTTVELDEVADPYGTPTVELGLREANYQSSSLDNTHLYRQNMGTQLGLRRVRDAFYVAGYRHNGLFGDNMYSWNRDIFWTHYDFGDIRNYNQRNNFFSGDLVMSFDIAQNPLPVFQTFEGDSLVKNFDYIAIAYAFPTDNVIGHLDDTAPNIVGITPREYDSGELSEKTALQKIGSTAVSITYNPDIDLDIPTDPLVEWDAGIIPHTVGSTLNPKNKDGSPIWDPELKQESMKDAKMIYNIPSFSPLVKEWYGTLSYNFKYTLTADEWQLLIAIAPKIKYQLTDTYSFTYPVALHVTNRYIQTTLRIEFDIFTSYNIDVGADGIEDFDLEFPSEYYDLLTWITTVEGFGGGEQLTVGWTPLGDYSTWIIIGIVVVAIITLFITLKFGSRWYRARQQRKIVELALKGKRRQ